MPSVRSVAIGFWIGVGSRDETPAKAGLTHFIEHLLFKGTRSYEARQIAETFDELGGELNAATSREHTVVFGRVPYDQLERAIDVMTDMVFVPTFADIDAEREVVLEEIAMLEDAPQDQVHDLVSEAVFGDHPLGRRVLGRSEVISSVSRRTIASFHESMDRPGNVVVAAAGNVAHERLVSLVGHVPGRGDDDVTGAVHALVEARDRAPADRRDHLGAAQYAPAEGMVAEDRLADEVVDLILRGVLEHCDLLEHDLALGVDIGEGRHEDHVGHDIDRALELVVGNAPEDDGVLARGGGVQLPAELVEDLGDLARVVGAGAFEE